MADLALLALAASGFAQASHRQKAPDIPANVIQPEQGQLLEAIRMLAEFQPAKAEAAVSKLLLPHQLKVYSDLTAAPTTVRAGYRTAIDASIAEWKQALAIPIQTVSQPDDANIVILFEPTVAVSSLNGQQAGWGSRAGTALFTNEAVEFSEGPGREATIRIAIRDGILRSPRDGSAIQNDVLHGIGGYLGIAPDATAPQSLFEEARSLQSAREFLLECARKHVALYIPYPALAVDSSEQDAGDVWTGDPARFSFSVRNTGGRALTFKATPSCGCTTTSSDSEIAPGASGRVEASLNTAGMQGKVRKEITLTSNDPVHPTELLTISANVRQRIEILPNETPTAELEDGKETLLAVELKIHDDSASQVTSVRAESPFAQATWKPLAGKNEFHVDLKFLASAPYGLSVARFLVTTTAPSCPQRSFSVICEKGIVAQPAGIFIANSQSEVTNTVRLTQRGVPFKVLKASADDSRLGVQAKEGSDGVWTISLSCPAGWRSESQHAITVETDSLRQRLITIPVSSLSSR